MSSRSSRRRRRRRNRQERNANPTKFAPLGGSSPLKKKSLTRKEKFEMNPFWILDAFFGGDGVVSPRRQRRRQGAFPKERLQEVSSKPAPTPEKEAPVTEKKRKISCITQVCAGCGKARINFPQEGKITLDEVEDWAGFWGKDSLQEIVWEDGPETVALCIGCRLKMVSCVKVNGKYTRTDFYRKFGERKDV